MADENKNPFEESIKDLDDAQKMAEEAVEHDETVTNGEQTAEELKKNDPSYILFNSILAETKNILNQDYIIETCKSLSENIELDKVRDFLAMLTIVITQAAFSAIVRYDQALNPRLAKNFEALGKCVNNLSSVVNGHDGVLKVLRKRVDDMNTPSQEKSE